MRIVRHAAHLAPARRPRIVAVGRFDGVHVGHQRVLARCSQLAAARRGEALVVLQRDRPPLGRLSGWHEQIELLGAAGVRTVVLAPLSIADAAAATLVAATTLVSGEVGGGGDACVAVERVESVEIDGIRAGAAVVRAALVRADLPAVARLLGREHAVRGRVVHGHHRGAPLGIPTANIRIHNVCLPADGVYAVRAQLPDRVALGVANIGFNPTFGNRERSVETHLLDFEGDLYGRWLRIAFSARLRGERTFPGVDALLAQVHADIARAREHFGRE